MASLTFLQQRTDLASMTGMSASDAAQKALIDRAINEAIKEIHSKADWPWTLDRQVVQTVADKTDGTVDVAAGGTAVSGASTAFASADVGKYIQFEDSNDWYKITAVSSTTSLTIEKPYAGTSALDDATYKIRQFYYSLDSTAEKILSVIQADSPRKVCAVDFRDFDRKRPFGESTGNPYLYFLFGRDSSDNLRFGLYPYADSIINLEIRYKKKPAVLSADTDTPDSPERYDNVIFYTALKRLLLKSSLKADGTRDLSAFIAAKNEAKELLAQMMAEAMGDQDDETVVVDSIESRVNHGPSIWLPEQFDSRGR